MNFVWVKFRSSSHGRKGDRLGGIIFLISSTVLISIHMCSYFGKVLAKTYTLIADQS